MTLGITIDNLGLQILADVLNDFNQKGLGADDLCEEYVGVPIIKLKEKYCINEGNSQVDFDLALKELEENELVDTGPTVAHENPPDSSVLLIGFYSKREFVYLTEKGYRAAKKSAPKKISSAPAAHISGGNYMTNNDESYPRYDGVLMKPGTRVYCDDRDEHAYDFEGTITAAYRHGPNWSFDVVFDSPKGAPPNSPDRMLGSSIWPTAEERDSEEVCIWRAEHSLRVFLCHASEDKHQVRTLYARLKGLGFRPWLDEVDLAPGVEWEPAIEAAVHDSHVILVCMSQTSTSKTGFVQKEIHFALERALEMPEGAIYIVPVRLSECALPKRLSRWQSVDLHSDSGENRLIQALRAKAKSLALLPR